MNNLRQNYVRGAFILACLGAFIGCKTGGDAEPDDPNELITTVSLVFTEQGTSTTRTVSWKDLDGEGGNAPVIGTLTLSPNTKYAMTTQVLDESKTPVEQITDEILEKKDEHLFVYTSTPAALMTVTITDKDTRNLPIGLAATVTTGAAGTGTLHVVLRHQPPVGGTAVKDGTAGPGSSDFDGTFAVELK